MSTRKLGVMISKNERRIDKNISEEKPPHLIE